METILIVLVYSGGCAWAASSLMRNKGRSVGAGITLGLILGLLGVLIAACMSDTNVDRLRAARIRAATTSARAFDPAGTKDCPRCAETVKAAAMACRYCGFEFPHKPAEKTPEVPVTVLSQDEYRGIKFTQYSDYTVSAAIYGNAMEFGGGLEFRQYVDDVLTSSLPLQ